MPAKPNRRIGFVAVFFNLLFWGIAPVIIKTGLDVVPPEVFLFFRFLIVIALATPILLIFRKTFSTLKTPKQLALLLGIGLFTNPLSLGMLFIGLSLTTSLAGSILYSTAPLFIILASAVFLHERVTKHELVGVAIATLGTAFIVFETPVQAHAPNPVLGNMLVLLQNILWTVGVILMKKFAQKHHPFLFGYTGWLTGMLFFFVYTLLTQPRFVLAPLLITQIPDAFYPIVYMAVFGSLIAFTAYQVAQKYLSASEVGIFSYLLPLVAAPLSIFWLHEQISPPFIVGGILLAMGVIVAEMHPSSRMRMMFRRTLRRLR